MFWGGWAMVQISRNLKKFDPEKLLQEQNEIRKKYGLRPTKRLQIDFLYLITDNKYAERSVISNEVMYQ